MSVTFASNLYFRTFPDGNIGEIGSVKAQCNKSSLLLFVPSVIDQLAMNVLINPAHPEAVKPKIEQVQPFTFDGRLMRKL